MNRQAVAKKIKYPKLSPREKQIHKSMGLIDKYEHGEKIPKGANITKERDYLARMQTGRRVGGN